MNLIYLQSLLIDNFRPFGEGFKLSLPGPGVTILTGPNGLGKTSFFDALEWGLTGRVARLADSTDDIRKQSESRYYARRLPDGTLSSQCSVKLQFSEGQQLERNCHFHKSRKENSDDAFAHSSSSAQSILELLCSRDWTVPINPNQLFTYLRQTHWLYQTAVHRFAAQSSQDRWDALSGPAGMDRLNLLQERLGHKLKLNLTKKHQDYAAVAKEKTARISEWHELLQQRSALHARASGGGALSPDEANTRLVALVENLRSLFSDVGPSSSELDLSLQGTLDNRMAVVLAFIQSIERTLAETATRLASIAEVPADWLRRQAESELCKRDADAAEKALAEAMHQEAAQTAEVKLLSEQHAAEKVVLADAEAQARQRLHLISRIEVHARLDAELDQQRAALERLTHASQTTVNRNQEMQKKLRELHQVEAERRLFVAEQQTLLETKARIDDWQQKEDVRRSLFREQASLKSVIEASASRLSHLNTQRTQQVAVHRQALGRLQSMRELVGQVSQAISTIAVHLSDDSRHCPVCLTLFDSGELKRRVESALQADQPALADAERAAEEARREIDRLTADAEKLSAELAQSQAQVASFDALLDEIAAMWQRLISSPVLAGVPAELAAIQDHIRAKMESVEQILQLSAERIANAGVDLVTLDENLRRGVAAENELSAALTTAQQRLRQLEQQHQEVIAALAAQSQLVSLLRDPEQREALEQTSAKRAEELRQKCDALMARYSQSENRRQEVVQARTALERQQASNQQSLSNAYRMLEELQRQWNLSGLDGAPNADVMERERQRLQKHRPALDGLRTAHAHIAAGLERWDAAEQARKAEEGIASFQKQIGCKTEDECMQRLHEELQHANADLEHAAIVRKGIDWLESGVKQVAEEYSEAVLAPVNLLAARFLRALSLFPGQHVSVVRWAHGANPHLALRVRSDQSKLPDDLSANHILSEGQMSAVSLSLLLSMSSAYRWSRWRALLLDDPLQNNDIIHVSAFADVIRNLVSYQKYQVVLSTHDSEVAEFLARKMVAAEVPYRICRFIAPSPSGVVTID